MSYGKRTDYYDERTHKTITFKSQYEYWWAMFFKEQGLSWEYEPVTFAHPEKSTKDKSLTYTPDFGLQERAIFAEIKTVNARSVNTWIELCDRPLIIIFGHPYHSKFELHVQLRDKQNKLRSTRCVDWCSAFALARHGVPSWLHHLS